MLAQQRETFEAELFAFKAEAWTRTENELRERRVQLLRAQIFKRMMNQQLSRGWTSWVERWASRRFTLGCQAKAVAHVQRYKASVALGVWWRLWRAIRMAKLARAEEEVRRYLGKRVQEEAAERSQAASAAASAASTPP